MSTALSKLISQWRSEPTIGGNVTKWHQEPPSPGTFADLPETMEPRLAAAFAQLGFGKLYSHQKQAWDLLQAGRHVGVVAGTASGKTLCYNLPVLDALLRDERARALYLFPTKSLAADQLSKLEDWLSALESGPELVAALYDGDTRVSDRPHIRKKARIILSNPDMLHIGLLPYHTKWAEFFANLRFVVLDEMHTYRGAFGSNVANVIRRLKRICAFYGAAPQFVFASATIANPKQLAEGLIEMPVEIIDQDGAPHGPRTFMVYNPPIVNQDLGIRASVLQEAVQLTSDILAQDIQTIVFGRTRRNIELMLTNLRAAAPGDPETIRGYRSGYLKKERRAIEEGLRNGEVRAMIATTALELGVDIGGLEAAVLAGYPGTIAATRQQAGRAGRSDEPSLVVLLLYSNPLEQYLARNPDYFLEGSPEHALINPDNLVILLAHVRCALAELPFRSGEAFGSVAAEDVEELLQELAGAGQAHHSGDKYFWTADTSPALEVSLRGSGTDSFVLQSHEAGNTILVGQIDPVGAFSLVHPEAIYIHEGRTYFVDQLDLDERVAQMHPVDVDYYTVPIHKITVEAMEIYQQEMSTGGEKHYGRLQIQDEVHRYEKVHWTMNEAPGGGELDLPPYTINTLGYWFAFDDHAVDAIREKGLWRNDPNDYGPHWEEVKLVVRARDDYTCQNCLLPENGRAHDVHHKIPFRTFASQKEANRVDNLVTLCPKCHRQAETMVRVRSGLSGLGFLLGHVAPLHLMCDPHNLGTHYDPKADFAGGKPAIAFYDNFQDGIGLSQKLYEIHDQLMAQALDVVIACECKDGCPACVGPGGELGEGSKQQTRAILEALTGK
ncbi:MAG: DUF1998 domain-containing protein [Chloroflexi bacterium]|nr:DEAD/DEAH box helicase [Chloroflexota bacterium]MQC25973.1 DUF1998 domain-containing protein [Chloroflexota bacterium]